LSPCGGVEVALTSAWKTQHLVKVPIRPQTFNERWMAAKRNAQGGDAHAFGGQRKRNPDSLARSQNGRCLPVDYGDNQMEDSEVLHRDGTRCDRAKRSGKIVSFKHKEILSNEERASMIL